MDILSAEMELQLSKVSLENDRLGQQLAREGGLSKGEPKTLNRLDYVWDRLCI
jgi:hypothetical protein